MNPKIQHSLSVGWHSGSKAWDKEREKLRRKEKELKERLAILTAEDIAGKTTNKFKMVDKKTSKLWSTFYAFAFYRLIYVAKLSVKIGPSG